MEESSEFANFHDHVTSGGSTPSSGDIGCHLDGETLQERLHLMKDFANEEAGQDVFTDPPGYGYLSNEERISSSAVLRRSSDLSREALSSPFGDYSTNRRGYSRDISYGNNQDNNKGIGYIQSVCHDLGNSSLSSIRSNYPTRRYSGVTVASPHADPYLTSDIYNPYQSSSCRTSLSRTNTLNHQFSSGRLSQGYDETTLPNPYLQQLVYQDTRQLDRNHVDVSSSQDNNSTYIGEGSSEASPCGRVTPESHRHSRNDLYRCDYTTTPTNQTRDNVIEAKEARFSGIPNRRSNSSEDSDSNNQSNISSLHRQQPCKHLNRNSENSFSSTYRNPGSVNDNSRRFGRRFDYPLPYSLQFAAEPAESGMSIYRQISAPNLNINREMEESLFGQTLPTFANHRGESCVMRHSSPMCYSQSINNQGDEETCPISGKEIKGKTSLKNESLNSISTHKTDGSLLPGENNPDALPGANLCYDFMNRSMCERQSNGGSCRFRHLDSDHPDSIADRFKNGQMSEEEAEYHKLRKCDMYEVNPFAPEGAKICFEFLNKKVCGRTNSMKICKFRHLLSNHPDAIADRARNGKKRVGFNVLFIIDRNNGIAILCGFLFVVNKSMNNDNDNPFLPEVIVVERRDPVSLNQNIVKDAGHPTIVLLHIGVKILSVMWYILCGLFSSNAIFCYVSIVLLAAIDFYITKNISGRILVSLRWWSVLDDNGGFSYRFESNEFNASTAGSRVDNMVFWTFLYGYPICWMLFCLLSLFCLHLTWSIVCVIAGFLAFMNAYLYLQASRKANQQVNILQYIPETVKTKAVNTFTQSFASVVGSAARNMV